MKRLLFNQETIKNTNDIQNIISLLQTSLANLYSQDIIFGKYRNIVAIASILEYFESGRCTELEGPSGAYNMFENEIRMNIIISSLSQIADDIKQIKNNQFTLYNMLNESTNEITNLLFDLNRGQAITAHYAEATAIAASADRISYGIIM